MKTLYLFYGFGTEYVLHNLFLAMQSDYECLEIDALAIKDSQKIINSLKGRAIVFVSSAHFLLDQPNFTDYYPHKNTFYGPLEIISLLKPVRSVYIPHDLTQPFIQHEAKFLSQYDLFLSPCEPYTTAYSSICPTFEVGWIKYRMSSTSIKPNHKAIWFLSDFILHIKMGREKSFIANRSLLSQGVSLKFPLWNQSDEFTTYYRDQGIDVYDASMNSYDLIEAHDIIVTNGLSSIVAESYYLGKTTINITENSHYGDDGIELIQSHFPEVILYNTVREVKLDEIRKTAQPKVLHHFNLRLAIQLITSNK